LPQYHIPYSNVPRGIEIVSGFPNHTSPGIIWLHKTFQSSEQYEEEVVFMKTKIGIAVFLVLLLPVTVFAQPLTHTVQSGDTLSDICKQYQVPLDRVIESNPTIQDPSLIQPGQEITIPSTPSSNQVKVSDTAQSLENEKLKVIELVNQERAKHGLILLKENTKASEVARYKCQDMINKNYFSHTSPTYGSPFQMMESFGLRFSAAGENIAKGQQSAEQVMNAWMNSPGHRSNILSPSYLEIGVGVVTDKNGVKYWTQLFLKPLS